MIVVASIIHPQGTASQFVQQSLWVPAHIFEYAGWTTILLGLVGWYSRFSASLGRLGTSGFLLFFLALATGVGYPLWSDLLLGPYMAANSPSLYDALSTNNGFIAIFLIGFFALVSGYLVFSVAVVRARVLQMGLLAHCSPNYRARLYLWKRNSLCRIPHIRGPFWTQHRWLGICYSLDAEPSREF